MLQIFKCNTCGQIVMVVHEGEGQLVCCKVPMEQQIEKTSDTGMEKHVPILEKSGDGVLVRVGSIPHPMEESHHIEWIEVINGPYLHVRGMKAGEKPEALFTSTIPDTKARIYCNVHGLWTNKAPKH
jgi:superoxide reductase